MLALNSLLTKTVTTSFFKCNKIIFKYHKFIGGQVSRGENSPRKEESETNLPVWAMSLSGKVREGLDHRALKDSSVLESVIAIKSFSLWLADVGCVFTADRF